MTKRLAMMTLVAGVCLLSGCSHGPKGPDVYMRYYPLVEREPEARFIENVVHDEMEKMPNGPEQYAELTPDKTRMVVKTTLTAHVQIREGLETMRSEQYKLAKAAATSPASHPAGK